MMLWQETDVLVGEPFVCLNLLDNPIIPSTFVARRRTSLLFVPFAANDVCRIMEISSLVKIFLSFFHFASASDLAVLFLWRKFHPQKFCWWMLGCWKIVKKDPFSFLDYNITTFFPKLNSKSFFQPRY